MTVSVTTHDGDVVQVEADRWEVDDHGHLHLGNGETTVASFAARIWGSAAQHPEPDSLLRRVKTAEAAVQHLNAVLLSAVPDEEQRAELWRSYWRDQMDTTLGNADA